MKTEYICSRPIHPGEILKEEIEFRGISQVQLAAQMGMSYKVLNHIINERRPLTTQTAMMLEAALGIPADSLMRIQEEYNKQVALSDKSFTKRLAEIRKIAAVL